MKQEILRILTNERSLGSINLSAYTFEVIYFYGTDGKEFHFKAYIQDDDLMIKHENEKGLAMPATLPFLSELANVAAIELGMKKA